MKKLLQLLGTINGSAIVTSNVIACDIGFDEKKSANDLTDLVEQVEDNLHSTIIEPQKTAIKTKSKPKSELKLDSKPVVLTQSENVNETDLQSATFETIRTVVPLQNYVKPEFIPTNNNPVQTNTAAVQKPIVIAPPRHRRQLQPTVITAQNQANQSARLVASSKAKLQIKPTYFFQDNNGKYYFVTDNGLYVLNQQSDELVKIDNIYDANIWHIVFDSKNNMYFASYSAGFGNDNYGELYVVKNNTTTAVKIEGIDRRVHNITIDNYDNVYLDTNNGLCVLNQGQTKAVLLTLTDTDKFIYTQALIQTGVLEEDQWGKLIDKQGKEIKRVFYRKTLGFDADNNLYFTTLNPNETRVLKNFKTKSIKINNLNAEVNSIAFDQNNVYFATKLGAYVLKQNETTVVKIEGLDFLGTTNKTNYFFIDKDRIYVGCLFNTYILDFNYRIINTLPFDSQLLQHDNQGNIYFGAGRGLYKFEIATNRYEKIKINKNGRLIETDDEIKTIYFVKNQIYFNEYTCEGDNFYKITTNNIAHSITESSIYA